MSKLICIRTNSEFGSGERGRGTWRGTARVRVSSRQSAGERAAHQQGLQLEEQVLGLVPPSLLDGLVPLAAVCSGGGGWGVGSARCAEMLCGG